jgi:hypothetical protein
MRKLLFLTSGAFVLSVSAAAQAHGGYVANASPSGSWSSTAALAATTGRRGDVRASTAVMSFRATRARAAVRARASSTSGLSSGPRP